MTRDGHGHLKISLFAVWWSEQSQQAITFPIITCRWGGLHGQPSCLPDTCRYLIRFTSQRGLVMSACPSALSTGRHPRVAVVAMPLRGPLTAAFLRTRLWSIRPSPPALRGATCSWHRTNQLEPLVPRLD